MNFDLLPWILEQEVGTFQSFGNKWRPKNLLMNTQTMMLMRDMTKRYEYLNSAIEELSSLDQAPVYIRLLHLMGMKVRNAQYARRSNQLAFVNLVADFYDDYGKVLRLLRIDQSRGKFNISSQV